MGYRVVYGPMPKMAKKQERKPLRLQMLTATFLLLFAWTVRQAWPEGREVLRQYLLPGEPTVTEEAFRNMLEDLRQGEPVLDAVSAFCAEIVEHGTPQVY